MVVRGDGWEVFVREVTVAGSVESWRPVVFFLCLVIQNGVAIQVWYLARDNKLAVAQNNELRQVTS